MFPEHKWIPYKLEHLDLSHNNMPVITKDMLVGTKHLKYLNISYNILTDIRKGNAEKGYHFFSNTLGQKPTFYPEFTKNLMFEKCEFCEKWNLEIVNFVKNETLKLWILC